MPTTGTTVPFRRNVSAASGEQGLPPMHVVPEGAAAGRVVAGVGRVGAAEGA